jgi:hypothetical protein
MIRHLFSRVLVSSLYFEPENSEQFSLPFKKIMSQIYLHAELFSIRLNSLIVLWRLDCLEACYLTTLSIAEIIDRLWYMS